MNTLLRPFLQAGKVVRQTLAILALIGLPAFSQVQASFSPQDQPLPAVTSWAIQVCAPEAVTISGGLIFAASAQRIRYLSRAQAQQAVADAAKRSPWRTAGLVLEYVGLAAQPVFAAGYPKIKEPALRALPGAATVGLTLVMALMKQQAPPDTLPGDYLGPFVQVPAPLGGLRSCAAATVWAQAQNPEIAFEVEVK